MAASGSAESRSGDAEMEEKLAQKGYEMLGVVHKNRIIHRAIVYGEISGLCASQNVTAMTKCMVRLNKVNTTASIDNLEQLKNSVGPLTSTLRTERNTNNDVFQIGDRRTLRFDRAGSTDSVAVSSGGSDHGGSDTCQSSDTTSVSDPYSPEAAAVGSRPGTPQPMPPIPDALREEDEEESSREGPLQTAPADDVVDKCERWCRERLPGPADEDPGPHPEPNDEENRTTAAATATADVVAPREVDVAVADATPSAFAPAVAVVAECSLQRPAVETTTTTTIRDVVADVEPSSTTTTTTTATVPAAVAPAESESFCKWLNCSVNVGSCDRLVEHIRVAHVDNQSASGASTFVCLWTGCKVYNRASCSISWLERHVVSHGGSKPFRCIVDGCRARFTSQGALERHVNSHFSGSQGSNGGASTGNGGGSACPAAPAAALQGAQRLSRKDDTPTKLLKKRRLMRFRRRGWPAKTGDFFDAGMMEHVHQELVESTSCTDMETQIGSTVNFTSTVIGRRMEDSGKVRLLLRWSPEDILPDQWILESQLSLNLQQSIPLWMLPATAIAKVDPSLKDMIPPKRRRK